MAKAIITGISGQDASFMAKHLLSLGLDVVGVTHHFAEDHVDPRVQIESLLSKSAYDTYKLIQRHTPDYVINLGGVSSPKDSWENPFEAMDRNATQVAYFLDAITESAPNCKFFSAGSCLEDIPDSPYAVSKQAAGALVRAFRSRYNLFAIHAKLYSHESPYRSDNFVSRKITKGVARIWKAIQDGEDFEPIILGDLAARRDWSHAMDIVWGIWLALNHSEPKDYTFCSERVRTVQDFATAAFGFAGLQLDKDNCVNGRPAIASDGSQDKSPIITGSAYEARKDLNWIPKISFERMVMEMVGHDIDLICQNQ
jgi:GDPmannose 4,6-dehydratase